MSVRYGPAQHPQQQQIHANGQQSHPLYGAKYPVKPPSQQNPQMDLQQTSQGGYVQQHKRYDATYSPNIMHDNDFLRNVEEEGAIIDDTVPIDEAIATRSYHRSGPGPGPPAPLASAGGIDPPEDEPPRLRKRSGVAHGRIHLRLLYSGYGEVRVYRVPTTVNLHHTNCRTEKQDLRTNKVPTTMMRYPTTMKQRIVINIIRMS
jgi:hypothetical protein